jgi:hypothetical protein
MSVRGQGQMEVGGAFEALCLADVFQAVGLACCKIY